MSDTPGKPLDRLPEDTLLGEGFAFARLDRYGSAALISEAALASLPPDVKARIAQLLEGGQA